jgi:hypothetical protein
MAREQDLVVALEMITEGARASVPPELRSEALARESARVQQRYRGWTDGPGIQGVGIGQKVTRRRATAELALKVYVERKLPVSRCRHPVPVRVAVPALGRLPTDVEEIGRVETESFTGRARPAMPGCGVAHPEVTVGTFGCLVRKRGGSRALFLLSNSHVLANEGVARPGDPILQPGPMDGGEDPRDVLGRLAEFVPFEFGATGYPNRVDAAIAQVAGTRVVREIRVLGVAPQGVNPRIRRGQLVQKVGRTTDHTTGIVRDVHYRLALRYRKTARTRARAGLRDQVLCSRYTAGGDSGSAVLDARKRLVGLHFAGSPSTSIFNKIEHVFTALDIELA